MKTILILVDGMRPDSLDGIATVEQMKREGSYALDAQTVFPSVTLPCHMSLFHSVDPSRHGITTNTFMPQVRPIDGICEVLKKNGKKCAMFYNWEELKDLSRPDSLAFACYYSGHWFGYEEANPKLTDIAVNYLKDNDTDFSFLYLGFTDYAGHKYGWMSDEYMQSVKESWECIRKVIDVLGDDHTVIVTADHGGHDRSHGSTEPEDMTIPVFIRGEGFEAGKQIENMNIKDIAPTICSVLGVQPDPEWEGTSRN